MMKRVDTQLVKQASHRSTVFVAIALLLSIASYTHSQPADNPTPQIVQVPTQLGDSQSNTVPMHTQLFLPTDKGTGPFPVVVFSHGRAGTPIERSQLKNPIPLGHARYWLNKGYAVVAAVRPGYGQTGGTDYERSGVRYNQMGQCLQNPDFSLPAKYGSQAIASVVQWVRQQSWAQPERILLVGQSVGGLSTVAACAKNLPGVMGCVNFAGGSGGDPSVAPGQVCAPDQLTKLMGEFGQTTKKPSIWFYASNDLYWGSEPPKRWHAAHQQAAQANGATSQGVFTGPVEPDGHRLLHQGGQLWSKPLNEWLTQFK